MVRVSELGVMRARSFLSAVSEPLFEFVQQPGDTGASKTDAPRKSPTCLPAQKRTVAYGNTKALEVSTCCEGLLSIRNIHCLSFYMFAFAKERSDKNEDDADWDALRAKVLKVSTRFEVGFSKGLHVRLNWPI